MDKKLLYYTQQHLKGISEEQEKLNWKKGILSMDDLLRYSGEQMSIFCENPIQKSIDDLRLEKLDIFIQGLDAHDYYRIAYSFPEKVMFLDIETTGLSKVYSYITVVGWMIDGEYKHLLYGNSIDELIDDLNKTSVIVTFNGSLFDLPFLKHQYPELVNAFKNKAHIDLRFFLKRFGYTGGQKEIENLLNFKRPHELNNVDGKEAISLWYKFLKNDFRALEKLLYYNCYDILGMVYLLNYIFFKEVYGKKIPRYGKVKKFSRRYFCRFIKYSKEEVKRSQATVKNKMTFFKHTMLEESYPYSVIGIDLTGSESKPSGCAAIKGNEVETARILSDDELIEYILKNQADLVSIDSPLSMPYGRTSVFDDDPKRDEIGIMRFCERELKKRGVNVYPSLIPSMQRLTKRGIGLAKRVRQLGIPVIESFPGAAQDVLQIPRKKTDMHFLKQGLIDFGIEGKFISEDISHDELDAITSALVGQFYISGYYEALGNEEEEYLIIPDINREGRMPKRVIGISGHISAGKTESASYISNKGYKYMRYSMVIKDYLLENGMEVSRDKLQEFGYKIFTEFGQYWLNKKLFNIVKDADLIVVDGIRHPEDISFLKEKFFCDCSIIFIESDFEIRKNRYHLLTGKDYDKVVTHKVEEDIDNLKRLSDYVISNNDSKEELFFQIDQIMNK